MSTNIIRTRVIKTDVAKPSGALLYIYGNESHYHPTPAADVFLLPLDGRTIDDLESQRRTWHKAATHPFAALVPTLKALAGLAHILVDVRTVDSYEWGFFNLQKCLSYRYYRHLPTTVESADKTVTAIIAIVSEGRTPVLLAESRADLAGLHNMLLAAGLTASEHDWEAAPVSLAKPAEEIK